MTKKEFIDSLDRLSPTLDQKEELFQRIREQKRRGGNKIVPIRRYALTALAVCLCLFFLFIFPLWKRETELEREQPTASQAELAMVTDYFVFQGKVYNGEQKPVSEQAVGEKLGTVAEGGDPNLQGCHVYQYLPVKGEAYLVLEQDGKKELYAFREFLSTREFKDEDAAEYLRVYGITQASDISSLEMDSMDGQGAFKTVKEREIISEFYNRFSVLKNASDEYYKTLAGTDAISSTPPDNVGSTVEHYVGPYVGETGDSLEDTTRITIRFVNGCSMETVYYPNIRFLGYYQLDEETDAFFRSLCAKN